MEGTVYRFGDIEVDAAARTIERDGADIHAQPQVFDVLLYLLEHQGRVVPKEELLDEVWGSRFVSESALASRIKSARQAIGDDGRRQEGIATVHGRGYRFVAPVEVITGPVAGGAEAPPTGGDTDPTTDGATGGATRAVPRSLTVLPERLVERDEALTSLRHAHRTTADGGAAGDGRGRIVVLRGEAGIGKTAVLQRFIDEVGVETTWALASCVALRTPSVLTPVFDLLDQLGRPTGAAPIEDPAGAVRALLARAATLPPPLVLGIDDIHWADDATLDVIAILARRLVESPILLVLTLRAEVEASHPVVGILADLRARGATVEELRPLTDAAVGELAGLVGPEADDLHARTGGNPLLVSQVLADPTEHVPGGVNDIVVARLSEMSDEGRRAATALAMSPTPLELATANTYLGPDLPALAEAEQKGLVTVSDTAIGFRHELVRSAVHDSVRVFDRLPLHRRLLEALPRGASVARRLHHAVEGVLVETVTELGPDAAREAARLGSHREAVELYGKTLRYDTEFEPELAAELTSEYAYQLYLVWDLDQAGALASRAAERWAELGQPQREGAVLTTLARVQVWKDSARAKDTGTRALELLDGGGTTTEAARAYCEMAGLHVFDGEDERGRELAHIGLRMAEELSDRGLQALALNYLGCVLQPVSDEWEIQLRRSIDLAVGVNQIEYAARAIANLSVGLWDNGRWIESAQVIDETESLIGGVEYQGSIITVKLQAAHVAATRGDHAKALSLLAWIEATDRSASMEFERRLVECRVLLRDGDPTGAETLRRMWADSDLQAWTQRATVIADGHEVRASYSTMLFLATVAELAWREGDRELAEAVAAVDVRSRVDFPLRTEFGELALYLTLAGLDPPADPNRLEPFALAVDGDLAAAAELFDERGRPMDAAACRQAIDAGQGPRRT